MSAGQDAFHIDERARAALLLSLSAERLQTYQQAAGFDDAFAFELYIYNARLAEAFLFPLHIAEVTVRNAIDGLLLRLFGAEWPTAAAFRRRLSTGGVQALTKAVERAGPGAGRGQIVATLTFDFWSNMLRADYDRLLWQSHLLDVFPSAEGRRRDVQDLVRTINQFRNRVAHHEPVFRDDVNAVFASICRLIGMRCAITEQWMRRHSNVAAVVRARPRRSSDHP